MISIVRLRVAGLAALLSISATACSSAAQPAEQRLTIGERTALGVATPDEVRAGAEEAVRTEQAQLAECVGEGGFEYVPLNASSLLGPSPPAPGSRVYVEQYGFGVSEPPPDVGSSATESDSAVITNQRYAEALSEDARQKYFELLEDCDSTSNGSVGGVDVAEAGARFERAFAELQTTPEYGQAVESWSACIADLGYQYESLDSLLDDLIARYNSIPDEDKSSQAEFRANEVRIALDTYECTTTYRAAVAQMYEDALP